MKKEEAFILSLHRSKLVIEYIEQILSGNEKVNGIIKFSSHKIDSMNMCTLNIIVPETKFEKYINLGIASEHCDILYAQLFKDFLTTFLEHETIGISKYYSIYSMQENFSGVNAVNSNGGILKINFVCKGQKFDDIVGEYNKTIHEYINVYKESEEPKVGSR